MKPLYQRTLEALAEAGHEAYVVGGFVRDRLLGRQAKDVDITTSAFPDELAAMFPPPCGERIGAHFSILLLRDYNTGESVELATFRQDGDYAGQTERPSWGAFTTDVVRDLEHRDFTLNALLMNANDRMLDYVGGAQDIERRMIRAVGGPLTRFAEDPLRMLRALRFQAELGFTIEEKTKDAIATMAHLIERVAVERVQQELNRILVSGRAHTAVMELQSLGLLQFVLPDVAAMWGVAQNPKYHPEGDVFTHTLALLEQLPAGCSLTLALGALLHDVGKPPCFAETNGKPTFIGHENVGSVMAHRILTGLKYSNEVIETVTNHVALHMRFRVADQMRRAKLYRFVRQPNFAELLELHRLDATAGSGNLSNHAFVRKVMTEVPVEVLRPEKLVTGQDLIEMGLESGPHFRSILDAIEEAQLEGDVTTRDQALALARKQVEALVA